MESLQEFHTQDLFCENSNATVPTRANKYIRLVSMQIWSTTTMCLVTSQTIMLKLFLEFLGLRFTS